MGWVLVHSVALQATPAGFDSPTLHARVAQLAEAPRSERGGWGFESLAGHDLVEVVTYLKQVVCVKGRVGRAWLKAPRG